ncbi:MAG: hypothetical protein VX223_00445 [Myxococcota bacterium]|nr:hypothetical protein [Myxococcota bacterium]
MRVLGNLPAVAMILALASCTSATSGAPTNIAPADFDVVIPDITILDTGAQQDAVFDPGPCEGIAEGGPCDDGDLCTVNDMCIGGFCISGEMTQCDSPADPCREAVCLPTQGCTIVPLIDESFCSLPCYSSGRCESGTCIPDPSTAKICPAPLNPCVDSAACNPEDGECNILVYALSCPEGFSCQANAGVLACVEDYPWLCKPCTSDTECEDTNQPDRKNLCVSYGDAGSYCGGDCAAGACPAGYECKDAADQNGELHPQCIASDLMCECRPEWSSLGFQTMCSSKNEWGSCSGTRYCLPGGLTPCSATTPGKEVCDGLDNDCDGQTDIENGCGPPGACCVGIGTCTESFKMSCSLQGGTFQGIGVDCKGAACGGGTTGACCLPNGSCALHTLAVCLSLDGQYLGDGQVCDGVKCATPPGVSACCRPNGTCSTTLPVSCTLSGGVYQGLTSSCSEITCPVLGACCLADTTCIDMSQTECSAIGADFSLGLSCSETDCLLPPGLGACCLEGGACAVLPLEECGGQALEGEMCVGQCASPTLGACCAPFQQGCTEVQIQECPATHKWEGANTVCAQSCIETTGICCKFGNCYPGLTAAQCEAVSGSYAGPDATCEVCQ